jgi:hypothetical protein
MEFTIKNLESIPEQDRLEFEQFLRSALSEEAEDQELRSYLINFIDEGESIDVNEIYQIERISNWKIHHENQIITQDVNIEFDPQAPEIIFDNELNPTQSDNLDLLGEFSNTQEPTLEDSQPVFDSDAVEPSKPMNEDMDLLAEFGYSSPDNVAQDIPSPKSFEQLEIPTPNIEFNSTTVDQADEGPTIPFEQPADEPIVEAPTDTATDKSDSESQSIKSDKENPNPNGQATAWAPQQSNNADVANAAQVLAASAMKLGSSLLNASSTVVDISGKAVSKTASVTGKVAGKTATLTANATAKTIDAALTKLKNRKMMTGKDRELLTGLPSNSNVVDIRSRMETAIANKTSSTVERDIKLIADQKLAGKRNTLISIMKGVENGYPNGRLSSLEIAPGVSALSAITGAMSNDPGQKAMAQAILRGNGNIPDAANEIEFVTTEYQRLSDTLSTVTDMAAERGWSQDDINKQFVEPVQEWMSKREDEDKLLTSLSNVQQEIGENDVSAEEMADRNRKLEEMMKELMKLINSIFNRNSQSETPAREATSTSSATRSR